MGRRRLDLEVDHLDCLWTEIILPKTRPILIGSVYRSPNSDFVYLNDILNNISNALDCNYETLILGDFNLDLLPTCKKGLTKDMHDYTRRNELSQMISEPTRVTLHSRTLLDHIYVNRKNYVTQSGVIPTGLSDHRLIYAVRRANKPKHIPRKITTRSFKRFHQEAFIDDISKIPFSCIEGLDDIDLMWYTWKTLFNEVSDAHAPLKTVTVKGEHTPWVTDEFISMTWERDHLKKVAEKHGSLDTWARYKKCRNKLNNLASQLKCEYFKTKIEDTKNDSSKLWSTLKEAMHSSKHHNIASIVDNGIVVNDKCEIANVFNNFFANIGSELASKFDSRPHTPSTNDTLCNFRFQTVSIDSIEKQLKGLSAGKATGLDNISARLLRLSASHIAPSLTYIINFSLSHGVFPSDWKTAKVSPVFKDGTRSQVDNYRPISVLPVVSKILERVVHDQLYQYLTSNKILNKWQSGFRPGYSTTTALSYVVDDILSNMDGACGRKNYTGILFLDFKKAFDTVDHDILLDKLRSYGVVDSALDWFGSYLAGRYQIVQIENQYSDMMGIAFGVPQGSIIGPLLFSIYINDLPSATSESQAILYADDTAVIYSSEKISEIQQVLSTDLILIGKWLVKNKLTLNVKKTKSMLFGTPTMMKRADPLILHYDSHDIEQVHVFRYLGVLLDSTLTFKDHLSMICKKISCRLGILGRVKKYLPHKYRIMVYNSLISPHFDYASCTWSNTCAKYKKCLVSLQGRAGRIILDLPRTAPTADVLSALSWIPIEQRWNYHRQVFMHKIHIAAAPDYLCDKYAHVSSSESATRASTSGGFCLPHSNTIWGRRRQTCHGVNQWNALPRHIRMCNNTDTFKNKLKCAIRNGLAFWNL